MNADTQTLLNGLSSKYQRAKQFWSDLGFVVVALLFGPALIVMGLSALPPGWRPGLDWPIRGERAEASVESIHLTLRHVEDDPGIDNFKASALVVLTYKNASGQTQRAAILGPPLLHDMRETTGDAAWHYLEDVALNVGVGPVDVDMPRDLADQLAVAHEEFALREWTAGNLDRPLRWIAVGWLAPRQALAIRFDPKRPALAIPESLIERESNRFEGMEGLLRALALVAGCILVGLLIWRKMPFLKPAMRAVAIAVALGSALYWAPYAGRLVRFVAPGIDLLTGLDTDEVAADPLAPFYDPFRIGPRYASAIVTSPALRGVAWNPDDLASHALLKWLRSVPVVPVRGSLDDAESALTHAAKVTLPGIDDAQINAIDADLTAIALRKYWSGRENYVELREAVQAEIDRRRRAGG